MTSSRIIKVFLASSITELEKERKDIIDSIRQTVQYIREKREKV